MGRLTAISPAPFDDCLALAGPSRFIRRAQILMRSRSDTVSFRDGEELLAVAYLWPCDDGTREFCLAIAAAARRHMLPLTRMAHLTLSQLAETGVTVATYVAPGHLPGERMARLVGFSPADNAPGHWRIKGKAQK